MRTRDEQIADIVSCLRFDNSGFAVQTLTHIAEKFIEEAEQRIKCSSVTSIDTQVLTAAREMTERQKELPKWAWLNPETRELSLGRWAHASGNYAPYIRADLTLEAEAGPNSASGRRLGAIRRGWIGWNSNSFFMALVKGPAPVAPDKKLDAVFTQTGGVTFRQAIDAAREVG